MIDRVGTSPFLRKALLVPIATMHFHIAQTGLLMVIFFAFRGGGAGNNLTPIQNCPWGAR